MMLLMSLVLSLQIEMKSNLMIRSIKNFLMTIIMQLKSLEMKEDGSLGNTELEQLQFQPQQLLDYNI